MGLDSHRARSEEARLSCACSSGAVANARSQGRKAGCKTGSAARGVSCGNRPDIVRCGGSTSYRERKDGCLIILLPRVWIYV